MKRSGKGSCKPSITGQRLVEHELLAVFLRPAKRRDPVGVSYKKNKNENKKNKNDNKNEKNKNKNKNKNKKNVNENKNMNEKDTNTKTTRTRRTRSPRRPRRPRRTRVGTAATRCAAHPGTMSDVRITAPCRQVKERQWKGWRKVKRRQRKG